MRIQHSSSHVIKLSNTSLSVWKLSISAYRKITNKHTLCCRKILAFFWRFLKHQSTLYCAVIAPGHKIIFKLLFLKSNILDCRQINWYNNFYLLPPTSEIWTSWNLIISWFSQNVGLTKMIIHVLSLTVFNIHPWISQMYENTVEFFITSYLQIYRHQRVKTPLSKLPLFLLQNMKNRIAQPWNNTDKQSKKSLEEITVTKI